MTDHSERASGLARDTGRFRDRLSGAFLKDLHAWMREHGRTAIDKVGKQQPAAILKIIAMTLPREHNVESKVTNNLAAISNEQLDQMIELLTARAAARAAGLEVPELTIDLEPVVEDESAAVSSPPAAVGKPKSSKRLKYNPSHTPPPTQLQSPSPEHDDQQSPRHDDQPEQQQPQPQEHQPSQAQLEQQPQQQSLAQEQQITPQAQEQSPQGARPRRRGGPTRAIYDEADNSVFERVGKRRQHVRKRR